MDRRHLEAMVREVVLHHVAQAQGAQAASRSLAKPEALPTAGTAPVVEGLLCEGDVLAAREHGEVWVTPGSIITPLARETADRYQIAIREHLATSHQALAPSSQVVLPPSEPDSNAQLPVIAVGADHGGVDLKDALVAFLGDAGNYRLVDVGTHGKESVDYPDFAHKVAALVSSGAAWRGIMVDGIGVGSCMAANRHSGVRAAMGAGILEVTNAREHNDANVLCLGGQTMGPLLAKALTTIFLATEFGGGRHARRVAGIEGGVQ